MVLTPQGQDRAGAAGCNAGGRAIPVRACNFRPGPAFLSFWISCAILALEISMTRVFSVILWYHFGFMIISLAMLGIALSGAAVHAGSRRLAAWVPRAEHSEAILRKGKRTSLVCAALLLPLVVVLTRIPLDPVIVADSLGHTLLFGTVILLTALPFFLLGYAQCAALEAGRERIHRVYGSSFLGGAAGVFLALGGMEYLGGGGGIALAGAAAWIGGGVDRPWKGKVRALAVIALAVIAACLLVFPGILPGSSRKHFPNVPEEQVLEREWNAFSSVVFYKNPKRHGLWAMPADYQGVLPETLGVAIDEWAITSIVKWDGPANQLGFFKFYPPTLGLEGVRPGHRALVIGAGGGVDVLGALYYGAAHVHAVEINPLIVGGVKGRYREYSGGLYDRQNVTVTVAEGRYFVERDENRYDRIILTGVDTFAATAAGAFALSENYIYTVEAFEAYLDHLEPGGLICMTRWFYDPPRQTLRLVAAALEAMARKGVQEPEKCFFIARARQRSLILMKREPFTPDEIDGLLRACVPRGAHPVYGYTFTGYRELVLFFTPEGRAEMETEYPYRVDAPLDDSPFLFEHRRWKQLFRGDTDLFLGPLGGQEILFITFLALLACLAVGLGIMGSWYRKAFRTGPALPFVQRAALAGLFFLLGVGYLTAESALLPKLVLPLGHPVYAMSVVLAGLLVFSGLGALASWKIPLKRSWMSAVLVAVALAVPLFFIALFGCVEGALLRASFPVKILLCLVILGPSGFVMGLPFPLAVRRFGKEGPGLVPRAFLWNGAGSALACPAATALAISAGFTAAFLAAACSYLLAALLAGLAKDSHAG